MSQETRYCRVGLFVLVGAALGVGAALLIGGGRIFESIERFETVFRESVQGLEVGSSVKFRGVKLGTVSAIGLVRDHYPLAPEQDIEFGGLVLVQFEMLSGQLPAEVDIATRRQNLMAMVDRGLRFRIAPLGITGTSCVEADYVDPKANPAIEIPWQPKHLYIPSTRSRLGKFASTAEALLDRIDRLDVETLLSDLNGLIVTLNTRFDQLDAKSISRGLVDTLDEAGRTLEAARQEIEAVDLAKISGRTQQLLQETNATLAQLRKSAEGASYDLEIVLENLRVTTENLRDLTHTLRQQPSLLLRSAPPEDDAGEER